MASSSSSQIRAQVAAIFRKHPRAQVIGIRTNSRWTAGDKIRIGETEFRVEQCDSALQAREALLDHGSENSPLVIVTGLDESALGQDVIARLVKKRLFPVQTWPVVQDLFQARIVAPSLRGKKWLAEFLLEDVPTQGYPPASSGVLDEETVWRIVLCDRFAFLTARPDAKDLLEWTLAPSKIALYQQAADEIKQGLREWIAQSAGEAGEMIFNCIDRGYADSAAALGLACLVIWGDDGSAELKEAAVRTERFVGDRPLKKDVAGQWAEAAERLVKQIANRGETKTISDLLERSDRLLAEVRAEKFAFLSPHSPLGYELRLERYGELLLKTLGNPMPSPELVSLAQEVSKHYRADQSRERARRVLMSLRLVRWLARHQAPVAASFTEACRFYVEQSSFVDWARRSIAQGDSDKPLAEAYQRLYQQATKLREAENKNFGLLLANWTETDSRSDAVLRIEEVLGKVVAKLAKEEQVLLIVADGMSYGVFNELIEEIAARGWQQLAPPNAEWPLPIIAALPSITAASRTSLLCGSLVFGSSQDEAKGFVENADLLAVSKSKKPPVLFHKGNLALSGSAQLFDEVRREIESPRRQVVAVVVNAIDDHLAKGEQLNVAWSLDNLPVIENLLEAARDSGRIVILTSDHGHVLERQTEYRKSGSGERFREEDKQVFEDEILVTGPRVLYPANHRMIAPWAENVRYGTKKHGYHGGVTPQECIAPLAVLARPQNKLKEWLPSNHRLPHWWTSPDTEP